MFDSISHSLATTSTMGIFIVLSVTLFAVLVPLSIMIKNFRYYRAIVDMPTSKIRSAHQGYVELEGEGEVLSGEEPILSGLRKVPCLWYEYKVEYYINRGKNSRWVTRRSGTSDRLFQVNDGTGVCIVDPIGAEVKTTVEEYWLGDSETTTKEESEKVTGKKSYRFEETRIELGEKVYVLGRFSSVDGRYKNDDLENYEDFIRDNIKDVPRAIMAQLKNDEESVKDIDKEKWQAQMKKSMEKHEREKGKPPIESGKRSPEDNIHCIYNPMERRRPFIIATSPQDDLVGEYKKSLYLATAVFVPASGFLAWVIAVRFLA